MARTRLTKTAPKAEIKPGDFFIIGTGPEADPKIVSSYGDGLCILVSITGGKAIAYVEAKTGDHSSGQVRSAILGDTQKIITDYWEDISALVQFVEDLHHFSKTAERGEKTQWVDGVYGKAACAVQMLMRLIPEDKRPTLQPYGTGPAGATGIPGIDPELIANMVIDKLVGAIARRAEEFVISAVRNHYRSERGGRY